MRRSRDGDPFAALGLPRRADLTNDEVRAAWRRVAAATHPDRADGGDPARFAAAAAAYMAVRTAAGRGEALADLSERPAAGLHPPRWTASARGRLPRLPGERGRQERTGSRGRGRLRPVAARLSRVRRGRPGRLALRAAAAAAVAAVAVLAAGWQPATPALITGAATWLLLTARRDLAPPR